MSNAFLDFLRSAEPQPPPVAKPMPKPAYPPVVYDRSAVWREIIRQSGGPSKIATEAELVELARLQKERARWDVAQGPDGPTAHNQLAAEWQRRVATGEPYDPLGFPSDTELTRRHFIRQSMVTGHAERITREARPVATVIVQRIPALAQKLIPAVEADEIKERQRDERRGTAYVPSEWLRQLYQTDQEVRDHLERLADSRDISPAAMVAHALDL